MPSGYLVASSILAVIIFLSLKLLSDLKRGNFLSFADFILSFLGIDHYRPYSYNIASFEESLC